MKLVWQSHLGTAKWKICTKIDTKRRMIQKDEDGIRRSRNEQPSKLTLTFASMSQTFSVITELKAELGSLLKLRQQIARDTDGHKDLGDRNASQLHSTFSAETEPNCLSNHVNSTLSARFPAMSRDFSGKFDKFKNVVSSATDVAK